MATFEPWRAIGASGPGRPAVMLKPEAIEAIEQSKRPVMVVGHLAAEAGMIDYLIGLGRSRRIPVIATGNTSRALLGKGYTQAAIMAAIDAGQRLSDREWRGPDGKGPYDLAIFAGLPGYMEWTILSGLRHNASHVRVLSLKSSERYYPGSGALPRVSGPCAWKACISTAQAFRALAFRPGMAENGRRGRKQDV